MNENNNWRFVEIVDLLVEWDTTNKLISFFVHIKSWAVMEQDDY